MFINGCVGVECLPYRNLNSTLEGNVCAKPGAMVLLLKGKVNEILQGLSLAVSSQSCF